MAVTRRKILGAALGLAAGVFGGAASAQPARTTKGVTRVEYNGADDPASLAAFIRRETNNQVAIVVFHAQWCGPCKQFFRDAAEIGAQPGQKFKVIGIDVGPPAFREGPYKNLVAAHKVMGTPTMQFYADGERQFNRTGLCPHKDELGRYLRDMQRALTGDGPGQVVAPRCDI